MASRKRVDAPDAEDFAEPHDERIENVAWELVGEHASGLAHEQATRILAQVARWARVLDEGDPAQRERADRALDEIFRRSCELAVPSRRDFLLVVEQHAERLHAAHDAAHGAIVADFINAARAVEPAFAEIKAQDVLEQLQRLYPGRPSTGPKAATAARVAGVLSARVKAFGDAVEEVASNTFAKVPRDKPSAQIEKELKEELANEPADPRTVIDLAAALGADDESGF